MSIHEWNQHVARQAAATRNPSISEAFLRAATPGHRARMVQRRLERLGYTLLLNQRGPELWMGEAYYGRGSRPVARQTGRTRLGVLLAICGELGVSV